ncbi:MAG: serine hydrolase domain-containing protein [Vicinamibacterales bacterium]
MGASNRVWRRLFFAVLALCFASSFDPVLLAQQATVPNPQFQAVRATILEAVKDGSVPSISVAVAKDGKVIWEESFGWANREKMIPATPHTMYSMASISKPISTTGLMILVDQGKVDLKAPVNKYIAPSELKAHEGNAADATVTHLLNHTSGLPLHYSAFYLDEPQRQPPSFTESIRRYGILVHPPGAVYQYANFGFGLVDHIITKVSGRAFRDFMKTEVFLPLGMTHSCVDVEPALDEYQAVRYDTRGNPVPFYISDHPGASQVYSSAHDLIRFGLFHLKHTQPDQKQILKPATIDLMKQDSDPNPRNDRYGLAWFLRKGEYGYDVAWHTGSMNGTNTILKFVPSEDIAVVVLINTASDLRQKLPNDIIGTLLPDYGAKWKAERDKPSPRREAFKPVPDLIGEWKGEIRTYEEVVPVLMIIQADGDVHVKIGNQMETLLNRVAFEDGFLSGTSFGTIPSGDARAHPHNISYRLLLDGKRLSGYASTEFTAGRSYGNFSSYVRLEKQPATPPAVSASANDEVGRSAPADPRR